MKKAFSGFAALLFLMCSLAPCTSCSSDDGGTGLSNDSSLVEFQLSECSDSLIIHDYANGRLVQSKRTGYSLRPSLYVRHGGHKFVIISYRGNGFKFYDKDYSVSISNITGSAYAKVFDLSIEGLLSTPIEVKMDEITGSKVFYKIKPSTPDFGWVEVSAQSATTKLSLLNGSYETGIQQSKHTFNIGGVNRGFSVYLLAPPSETEVDFHFSLYND